MTATREYVNKTNEFLQQESALNALNVKAFKDIERPFFIKPMEERAEEINLERNIAETNLKQITTSDEVAKGIVQSLVNNNELSTFNRYFSVFQRALKDQKLQSLGQFSNIFNNFKTNIVTDISKTGLLPAEEILQSVKEIKSGFDLEKIDITDILNLNTAQLTNLFLETAKKELNRPLKVGDILMIPSPTNYGERKAVKITKVSPLSIEKLNKLQLIKTMIRYILDSENKYNRSVYNELRKFKPSTASSPEGSPVGSPVGSPEAEAESTGEFTSGSGLLLLRNSRTNYMMGRGIKSQKKS
jgi:hypothetical protein